MRIRITSDGNPAHTTVRDAVTGEFVEGVVSAIWRQDGPGVPPIVILEITGAEVDVVGDLD